jgi:colicin import membrane protein
MSKKLAEKQVEWDLHENAEALIPLEFTEEIKPDLFGLELTKAQEMTSGLSTTLAEREVLKNAYIDVIELPITTETLPTFKELRLKIVKNRTQGITKWKEKEKAFYLAGGNFIQAIYNKEVAVNEEMESKLLEAEKFFENQEKEKARLLNDSRIEKIRPYVDDVNGLDFTPMTDEDFDDYLLGKKTRFENEKKECEAEAKRIEAERLAEIEKQKAIELENVKLKAEAEAKEKALEKERAEAKAKQDAVELKAKQEREKAEAERKIEADKQAKIQAEKDAEIKKLNDEKEKAENERLEKEKTEKLEAEKLAKAPIKKQLSVWVNSFQIDIPDNHLLNNDTTLLIKEKFEGFKKWSLSQVDSL